jgi:hypothetical protein
MNDKERAMGAAETLVNTIRQRIESRYRRIRFVHEELVKLDRAAKKQMGNIPHGDGSSGPAYNGNFEDFVFSHIDFSVYKKIDAEEFRLLFDEGLADFEEAFFQKAFTMNRENVRSTIKSAYIKVGTFFVSKSAGPLILSIMRTLHSSLEFAPLLTSPPDLASPEQLRATAGALDGTTIRHDDGMETLLFVPKEGSNPQTVKPQSTGSSLPVLCGTFHPLNKAYTITLIPAL